MAKKTTLFCALGQCMAVQAALAIDTSVPFVHGDQSRVLLGDGTGLVIGIVDSGVDGTHPALTGADSLGSPRLVAKANFVTSEPANNGEDVFGHGTWVASAALSSHPLFAGMAPDARFVNARVLDANNSFASSVQVRNGIGFAIEQGAHILNLSLNFFAASSSGNSQLDLMVDWAAYERGISSAICCGNISQGSGTGQVRGPGSAYNGVTVGRTTADFGRVHPDSAEAFTSDGRMKPDLVAPGTGLTLANDDWEGAAPDWDTGLGGCSFATPHVAGLMAQQLEAGAARGLSTSPLVVKATMMNSANKVADKQGNSWAPARDQSAGGVFSADAPLDGHSGAGQIDGLKLATQYLAGDTGPGSVGSIGWDLNAIADDAVIDYAVSPELLAGSTLTATLTWHRHVTRSDDGNGVIDANDTFSLIQPLSDLTLQILRDGILIAASNSPLDNVEHLNLVVDQQAHYTLRVSGDNVFGGAEMFALAWYATAVPEPAGLVLLAAALAGAAARRGRRTRSPDEL